MHLQSAIVFCELPRPIYGISRKDGFICGCSLFRCGRRSSSGISFVKAKGWIRYVTRYKSGLFFGSSKNILQIYLMAENDHVHIYRFFYRSLCYGVIGKFPHFGNIYNRYHIPDVLRVSCELIIVCFAWPPCFIYFHSKLYYFDKRQDGLVRRELSRADIL